MESTPEETAEGLAVVRVLAAVLDRLVCANAPLARTEPVVTKFHALKAPGIGIQQYLERIHKYACCSSQCFIMALIYIDRLIQRNNFLLTDLNVHRVIVTAILLAAKFFDDAYYNNAYYAKVGGVLISEMNGLEVDFLFRINFSLHVTPELFEQYRAELLSHSHNNSNSASLPVPPPPQISMPAPSPYTNRMPHDVRQVPLPHEPLQQLQAMAAYPVATMTGPAPQVGVSQQITPSPTRAPYSAGATASSNTTGTSGGSTVMMGKPHDERMVSVEGTSGAVANAMLPTGIHLFPHELAGGYLQLQRANSLPAQNNNNNMVTKAQMMHHQLQQQQQQVQQQQQQQHNNNNPALIAQPLSAPTMVSVVPGNEQFVVLDHQVYQLPGTGLLAPFHHQHQQQQTIIKNPTTIDPTTAAAAASGLIHHVHHPAATTGHAGFVVSREAAVASQRFAAVTTGQQQMVAGVSSGGL